MIQQPQCQQDGRGEDISNIVKAIAHSPQRCQCARPPGGRGDSAFGKLCQERLLSESLGRFPGEVGFQNRRETAYPDLGYCPGTFFPELPQSFTHTLTRRGAQRTGRGWPSVALTWEMTSLKDDLNSCTSVVNRLTSCPVFLASKKAISCLAVGPGATVGERDVTSG